MRKILQSFIDFGVPANLGPEQAKYIQMSNLGSLLMITVNLPYLALCALNGWTAVFLEICAVDALLLLTPLLNRRGHHLAAVFYFGTLLNLHLAFVTVAMGRESLLQLLIFYTAGGAVTLIRRGRAALMILALVGILGTYQAALALERAFGPLYALSPAQLATIRVFVMYSVFLMIVVNALIGRYGAIAAEDGLRAEKQRSEEILARETRFFQNVSHELRTPLTLILGPLHGLLDDQGLEQGARSRLRMVARNARRLLRLINQLLDFSRLSSMKLRSRPGDLAAFLEELAEPFAQHAGTLGVRFQLQCSAAERRLDFDPEIVEKIVSNLLSNACKFTPPGGEVRLELADGPGCARISVSDTGSGIPPANRERVFERFYSGEPSGARRGEGAGIGLNLARELAQVHGGSLQLDSGCPRGSRFVLTLPRQAAGPAPGGASGAGGAAPADSPAPAGGVPPLPSYARLEAQAMEDILPSGEPPAPRPVTSEELPLVLVIDDSADMRGYLRQGLEPRYRVLEAADGREGLRRAREQLPRLIISDVMMPGVDGLALCRALHQDSRLRLLPVILLTARAAPREAVAGLEAGAVDYLVKPFPLEVLLAKVRMLLERREEQEQVALRDGLTGLLTRRAWEQVVERELARVARHGGSSSLAFLDLDDFKQVNDRHGHPAGDQVLLELARALSGRLRGTDLVGRYGGEEFVVFLPGSSGEAAVRSIQRVQELFRGCGQETQCTFSAGVAEIDAGGGLGLADYLARADEAMYQAKKLGKQRVLLWRLQEQPPRRAPASP